MKNFLKSDRHLHKDEAVRLEAVQEFDANNAEHQSLLEGLVDKDESLAVRVASLGKITNLSRLNQTLLSADDPSLATAATARLAELVSDQLDAPVLDAFLVNANEAACEVIATSASAADPRLRALAKISNEAALVRIVQASKFHDTRLAAAEKLVSHDSLRAALTASRSRDKEVAKHIQQRLDALAEKEAAVIASRHAANDTAASLKTLAGSVWSPQTKGRLDALTTKWSGIDAEYTQALQSSFDADVAAVQALIQQAEQKAEQDAAASADTAPAVATSDETASGDTGATPAGTTDSSAENAVAVDAKPVEASTPITPAAPVVPVVPDDECVKAIKTGLTVESLDGLAAAVASTKAAIPADQLSASEPGTRLFAHAEAVSVMFDPPFETQTARVSAVNNRIRRVEVLADVQQHLAGIDLTGLSYVDQLGEHLEALKNRLGKAKQESDDRVKATHRQFSALTGIVKEGKWGPASSMFRRLQKKINAMEAAEKAVFADKLSRAEGELSTMADWQDFAARPKLEALCEKMEALPAQELAPDALAKEVRTLQNEWKALGVSRASNDLWSRFKTAGDTAYEPCKAFFEEKQKERQAKIDNKKSICDALDKSLADIDLDSETVDWKAVQRIVNNAKRDWSRNRVTDRKPDRKLEERFTQLLKPVEAKLTEQHDANAVIKKDLIEKVTKLATGEINQHAANQARSLQSNWKAVGITRRKEDQELWEQFNSQCRIIFKTIKDAEREKYKASMGHVFRAKDIIKTLKQHAKSGDADDATLQALSTEFNNLAEFPERDKKFLFRDFRAALDANSKRQETKTRQKRQQVFDEVKRLVGLCEQLEDAVELPEMMTGTLVEETVDAWDATDVDLPKDWSAPLIARRDAAVAHINKSTQYDYSKTEAARRELLIKMEVAAGVDTPAEDKALRMQFQLANLQQGMTGSAVSDKKTELKSLEREWLSMAPGPRDKRDSLNSRYLKAMKG